MASDNTYKDRIDEIEILIDANQLVVTQQQRCLYSDYIEQLASIRKTSTGCSAVKKINLKNYGIRAEMGLSAPTPVVPIPSRMDF